jgi:hypothetical protein
VRIATEVAIGYLKAIEARKRDSSGVVEAKEAQLCYTFSNSLTRMGALELSSVNRRISDHRMSVSDVSNNIEEAALITVYRPPVEFYTDLINSV